MLTNNLILYEHPLTEHIRTLLKLENLYERFIFFLNEASNHDHHAALATLFEIWHIASRNDLKNDLLRELENNVNY